MGVVTVHFASAPDDPVEVDMAFDEVVSKVGIKLSDGGGLVELVLDDGGRASANVAWIESITESASAA